jgi:hypothetical protein
MTVRASALSSNFRAIHPHLPLPNWRLAVFTAVGCFWFSALYGLGVSTGFDVTAGLISFVGTAVALGAFSAVPQ